MTDSAGGRERSLINLYRMRKGAPHCSLRGKVSLELIVVLRSRNTETPQSDSKDCCQGF